MCFVMVQSRTTPQYNESGNKFQLIPSLCQAFSLQELSVKDFWLQPGVRSHSFKNNNSSSKKVAQHLLDNGHSFGKINDVLEVSNFSKKRHTCIL
jgi:hypothetical protein